MSKLWNNFLSFVFNKIIWYEEEGERQIGRIFNKGPELMAVIFLFEKMTKQTVSTKAIIILVPVVFFVLWLTGVISKKYMIYEQEIFADVRKNPVSSYMYETMKMLRKKIEKGEKL